MLVVEVGGDDEDTFFIESVEGFVVDFRPFDVAVDEVLVAHEGDVEVAAECGGVGELRGVLEEEFGVGLAVEVLPALGGCE